MSLLSSQLQEVVVDLFFPRRCLGCGRLGSFLCDDCTRTLPRLFPPFCQKCGKPGSSGGFCPDCWSSQEGIDGVRSPFRLEGTVRQAVHALKYDNLRAVAPYLARLMRNYLQSNPVPGDILVPVPLHPRRLRQRGYNQSVLLARELSKLIGLPVIEDCLCRSKNSLPQVRTTNVEERRNNVIDAFICRNAKLAGAGVMLIDDVCTTGATLEACASALKKGGTRTVWGLTLAREV
ncbi:MAG: ComF family protein [Chloroflexi bacterium]|nr:ComF family protein [Chloroflexota bacterium]MBM3154018.1 ComF family protein [Chloroflexota bacterium]MBM3172775.1 ComF family protein [Chloroflexota bacterium]MBM3174920.1 ComF family protein [Chloroflexota bacterium]MBM4449699.1 ComF family protein [Chloroflexota bacterium]